MDKCITKSEEIEPPGLMCSQAQPQGQPTTRASNKVTHKESNRAELRLVRRSDSISRAPSDSISLAFRKQNFPLATSADWNDWRWHLRHRLQSIQELNRIFHLSEDEKTALSRDGRHLPVAITPYYASLLDTKDALNPLRRTVIPVTSEYLRAPGEAEDPLGEENDSPVPGLIHRYPDRVLFLVTDYCSTYCRYCTRSRRVGRPRKKAFDVRRWEEATAYIKRTPSVRDVLLSGGDPLTLPDGALDWLLNSLRHIPHVELLRIGTKVPAVLPQRITPALVRMLRRYHPLWMSIHFTHPDELTPEVEHACGRLSDAGIPLGSQTVLLSGINDDVVTMKTLFQGLLRMRVRPYYLYQCDPICGSAHFRTPVEKGLEIIRGLRGHTSGYAVPTYVIDSPGGGGKIPLIPDYLIGRDGHDLLLKNYEGNVYRYPDCGGEAKARTAKALLSVSLGEE
jgi:lysine 2,3-aminomutase